MLKVFKEEAFGITKRIRQRDFSGNEGQAVKNSFFQICTNLIGKIGSLLFTIILARLLLPELFGLYSLALATIVLLSSFTDIGITTTLVRFLSREFIKKKPNSKGYVSYFFKIKLGLTLIAALVLAASAYFIANVYYQKPIFYALLAGIFYIISVSFIGFFSAIPQAKNKFQIIFYKEIIFQILRLIFLPLVILLTISRITELRVMWIILSLATCYSIALTFIYLHKGKYVGRDLNRKEKREVNKFILPLTATVLSGMFFSLIDQIMLGRFVSAEFIGYYSATSALIGSIGAIIGFAGALFPIFSRLKGKRLEKGLKKALFITFPVAILAVLGTILFAKFGIKLVYGTEYLLAVPILQLISLILISDSLTTLYSNYFIVEGKTKFIAKALIYTTIMNIVLNYFLITSLLIVSQMAAVYGAAIATLISRYLYLGILILAKKKE